MRFKNDEQRKAVMAKLRAHGITAKPLLYEKRGNFERIRLKNPSNFTKGTFRTIDPGKPGGMRLVIGRLKGKKTTSTQAVLFPLKKGGKTATPKLIKEEFLVRTYGGKKWGKGYGGKEEEKKREKWEEPTEEERAERARKQAEAEEEAQRWRFVERLDVQHPDLEVEKRTGAIVPTTRMTREELREAGLLRPEDELDIVGKEGGKTYSSQAEINARATAEGMRRWGYNQEQIDAELKKIGFSNEDILNWGHGKKGGKEMESVFIVKKEDELSTVSEKEFNKLMEEKGKDFTNKNFDVGIDFENDRTVSVLNLDDKGAKELWDEGRGKKGGKEEEKQSFKELTEKQMEAMREREMSARQAEERKAEQRKREREASERKHEVEKESEKREEQDQWVDIGNNILYDKKTGAMRKKNFNPDDWDTGGRKREEREPKDAFVRMQEMKKKHGEGGKIPAKDFKEAIAGEKVAISDYERIKKEATANEAKVISHIQGEEKQHLKELRKLKGGKVYVEYQDVTGEKTPSGDVKWGPSKTAVLESASDFQPWMAKQSPTTHVIMVSENGGKVPEAFGGFTITPDKDLAGVIGKEPVAPSKMTKKVWAYVKSNKLGKKNPDKAGISGYEITPDEKLAKVIGKEKVSPTEMTKKLWQHVRKEQGGKVPEVVVKEDVRFVGAHQGDRILIDKDVPKKFRPSLAKHEYIEGEIQKEGIPYIVAHKISQRIERETFPHGKKEWKRYSRIVNKIHGDNIKKGITSYRTHAPKKNSGR